MSLTFIDYAVEVLQQAEAPLTYQEIWESGKLLGLDKQLKSKNGKTPWATLAARLYVEVRDNSDASPIIKVGQTPARFFLRTYTSEITNTDLEVLVKEQEIKAEISQPAKVFYSEHELHPLLAYFAASHPEFNRGKAVYTKTIFHQESTKTGYNKWVHPDMVGFYLPVWDNDIIDLNRMTDNNALRLFSFELKKSINKGNYREVYFQAVSNSSWAHEGYLVAAHIQEDDGLLMELNRLVVSFGIGIIKLELPDIDTSRVLYPATPRQYVDWEMVQKLFQHNVGYRLFIADVRIDFSSKKIHPSEYDKVMKEGELEAYLSKLMSKH